MDPGRAPSYNPPAMLKTTLLAAALAMAVGCDQNLNNNMGDIVLAFTTRASISTAGLESDGASAAPALSADGRFVVFVSAATNLTSDPVEGVADIFLRDRSLGATELVSIDIGGGGGNGPSSAPSISADGRYVAFQSKSSNLVADVDDNGVDDIFVRDRVLATTTRVSRTAAVALANGACRSPAISADGSAVAFESDATNLDLMLDGNNVADIFVKDLATGDIERVSIDTVGNTSNGPSSFPEMSGDGRYVAFESTAANLVSNDGNGVADVFLFDRQIDRTERISVDVDRLDPDGASSRPVVSSDGRFVAYDSEATDLTTVTDTNSKSDVFVHDRVTHLNSLVSRHTSGALGSDRSLRASISADGRFVAFRSEATNLVDGDTNNVSDVFVRDRTTGTTVRISVKTFGTQVNDPTGAVDPTLSADGRTAAFVSAAQDLVDNDTNGAPDVFVRSPLY